MGVTTSRIPLTRLAFCLKVVAFGPRMRDKHFSSNRRLMCPVNHKRGARHAARSTPRAVPAASSKRGAQHAARSTFRTSGAVPVASEQQQAESIACDAWGLASPQRTHRCGHRANSTSSFTAGGSLTQNGLVCSDI